LIRGSVHTSICVDRPLDVLRLIDIDDHDGHGVLEEEPDASETVLDAIRLREITLRERVTHPPLGSDLLCQGCHVDSIPRAPVTDQDIAVPTLCQLRHASVGSPSPTIASLPSSTIGPYLRHHEPGLVGDHDGLRTIPQAELGEHAGDVGLDRVLAEHELAGDLGVGAATAEEP
jgi:hypothetical protein